MAWHRMEIRQEQPRHQEEERQQDRASEQASAANFVLVVHGPKERATRLSVKWPCMEGMRVSGEAAEDTTTCASAAGGTGLSGVAVDFGSFQVRGSLGSGHVEPRVRQDDVSATAGEANPVRSRAGVAHPEAFGGGLD